MGLSQKSNYEKKSFLVLTSGNFLEALGSRIGTGSIFCLSFSLSNRVTKQLLNISILIILVLHSFMYKHDLFWDFFPNSNTVWQKARKAQNVSIYSLRNSIRQEIEIMQRSRGTATSNLDENQVPCAFVSCQLYNRFICFLVTVLYFQYYDVHIPM